MIVSGGFNVYATDIEQVIADHPQVAEVAVIGIPHPRWGEVPLAVVIARPSLDEADLVEWTNARLAKHQRIVGGRFSHIASAQRSRQDPEPLTSLTGGSS